MKFLTESMGVGVGLPSSSFSSSSGASLSSSNSFPPGTKPPSFSRTTSKFFKMLYQSLPIVETDFGCVLETFKSVFTEWYFNDNEEEGLVMKLTNFLLHSPFWKLHNHSWYVLWVSVLACWRCGVSREERWRIFWRK